MIVFEEYGLTPREFAILARMSVTKMRTDPDEAVHRVDSLIEGLHEAGLSFQEWVREDVVPGVTPITLWKRAKTAPVLASLLADPATEVARVFPELETTRNVDEQIQKWKGALNQGG